MADLIAIGYEDEETAQRAAEEIAALSKYGGTVLKTSLSTDAEEQLKEALAGAGAQTSPEREAAAVPGSS
jgi:uncharacterized membrane protein